MYTIFFGLRELPFPLANDPHFFYSTPATQKAEQRIVTALQEHSGLVLLTGEPGTGKTTLLYRITTSLGPGTAILLLPFAAVTFDDILTHLCDQLHIIPAKNEQFTKILAIQEYLQTATDGGMRVVLCIDEAQDLRKETLDRLRLLLHLKGPRGKLLQILLVGQQSLEVKLAHPDLRHLQQYISAHCRLEPLSRDAVRAFILHRLHIAGTDRSDIFGPEAIERITHYSLQVPRSINIICDNALIAAYLARSQTVSGDLIDSVARNLKLRTEDTVQAVQEPRISPQSVQKITHQQQAPDRQWFNNLVWTGAGVLIAWISSSSQPFSFSLPRSFFIPNSAQTSPSSPSSTTGSISAMSLPHQSQTYLAFTPGEALPPTLNVPIDSPNQLATTPDDQKHGTLFFQPDLPLPSSEQAQNTARNTAVTSVLTPQDKHPSSSPPIVPPTPTFPTPRTSIPARQGTAFIQKPLGSSPPAPIAPLVRGTRKKPTREALFRAVTANDIEAVSLLLTARVSVNAKDDRGWTALMMAARDNHLDLVRFLLSRGAMVNIANKEGETALMYAADNDHLAIVRALIEHGASIDTKSNLGWTALMYAASKGHRLTVETLLANGANPGVKDKNGRTASMYATWHSKVSFPEEPEHAAAAFRSRLGSVDKGRLELVKRRDYSEIASLLKEAETKK